MRRFAAMLTVFQAPLAHFADMRPSVEMAIDGESVAQRRQVVHRVGSVESGLVGGEQ